MMSIEDTENLIRTMRSQARALDAGADALEQALLPMKAAMANMEAFGQAGKAMMDFWLKATKLDIKA